MYSKTDHKATCKCIHGVLGESCQHPCPGKGFDLYGKFINQPCADRGKCYFKEEVRFTPREPLTEARKVSIRLLTEGIGKYKGAYDFKRLTGMEVPDIALKASDVHSTNLTAEGSMVPPRNADEFNTMQQSIAAVDHTAECECKENLFGFACQTVCPKGSPSGDGKSITCRGRGPDPKKVGRHLKVLPLFEG